MTNFQHLAGPRQRNLSLLASLPDINSSSTAMPSDLQCRERDHAAQTLEAKSTLTSSETRTPSLPLDLIELSRETAAGASDGIGMDLFVEKKQESLELSEVVELRRELAAVKARRTTSLVVNKQY